MAVEQLNEQQLMKFLRKLPLSPFLLTIYFVLGLWVVNFDQTPFNSIFRVLVQVLILALFVFTALWFILKDWIKTGLASSFTLFTFFTYGHVFDFIKLHLGPAIGRHRYFLPLALGTILVGVFLIKKMNKRIKTVNLWVNLVVLFLFASASVQSCIKASQLQIANPGRPKPVAEVETITPAASENKRDIYYIVMDSYAGQQLLLDEFGFDNTEFLQQLKDIGFIVPECTISNYDTTPFSLSSTLNMTYLDDLGVYPGQIVDDESQIFYEPIRHSAVREKFEAMGYQFITFKTLYQFLNITDSDIYYDVEQTQPFYGKIESINFQYLLYGTTMLLPFNPSSEFYGSREYRLYDQYNFALTKIKELTEFPGGKFVYAHLFLTHSPFVYQTDGSIRESFEDSTEAYRDQIVYSNGQLLEIIDGLIKKSSIPPIIILQGDHSYSVRGEKRLQILNAYYLPDGGSELVYSTFTPVNTFRLIFNYYFGEDLPFLPDKSYYREPGTVTYLREAENACRK